MSNRKCLLTIASIIAMLSIAQSAFAASGSWTAGGATADPVDNTWGNIGVDPFTTGNWTGGIMANDVDSTATFNLDVGAGTLGVALGVAQPVTLENSYTVGNLIFGDTAPSTPGGWIVNETVINPDPNFYDASTLTLNVTPGTGTPPVRPTITVNDLGVGAEVTMNIALQGGATGTGLVKAGVGTLNLTKQNKALVGATVVNAGMLKLTSGNDTLDTTSEITVNAAGTLDLGGFSQTTSGPIVLNGTVQNGTLVNSGAAAFDGRSGTVSANLSEVSGTPVGLTKTTGGTLTLSGTNTYTGGTTINEGNVVFSSPSAIPATGQIAPMRVHVVTGSSDYYIYGALEATGAHSTAQAWLDSGKISNTSTGALALTADDGAINLATGGYASLSIGAAADVNYTGTITPGGNTYYLGGGGKKLTLAITDQLTDDGSTPRSLIVSGPGTLEVTGSNSFSGGTTIRDGILRVGDDASLGGPNTQLTLNGGMLAITGGGLTLDNRNVNWSTLNGGFYIDPGITFTLNKIVTDGGDFSKSGPGTFNIAGGYTLSKGVALNEGVTNIEDGAYLTAQYMNFFNGGGSGQLVLGTSGSSSVTNLTAVATGSDYWNTGYIKMGGGGGTASVDMYGNNTTLQADHFLSFGEWGSGDYSMNVNDGVLLKTEHIYIADWGKAIATVSLNNNARIEALDVAVGSSNDGDGVSKGTLNANGYSSIAVNNLTVTANGTTGILNVKDHAVVYAGELNAGRNDWWTGNSPSTVLITDDSQVNVVTAHTMLSGYAISGSGDLYVAKWANSNTTFTVNGNAQLNVANKIYIANADNAIGNLIVGGNAQVTSSSVDISTASDGWGGWYNRLGSLTMTENGLLTTGMITVDRSSNKPNNNAIINLNGGTLVTTGIASVAANTGIVNFNGGILKAAVASTTFLQGLQDAKIDAGGAKIDTNSFDITIAQSLSEVTLNTGSLTKLGAGTLTLTGPLHYQGLSDIQQGTLQISTAVPTQIGNVNGSGTLDVENATALSAFSVSAGAVKIDGVSSLTTANVYTNTLTIGAGSKLTITPIAGGPLGGGLTAVPEPSTLVMLTIAALGMIGAAWRRRNS